MDSSQITTDSTTSSHRFITQEPENETIQTLDKAFIGENSSINLSSISNILATKSSLGMYGKSIILESRHLELLDSSEISALISNFNSSNNGNENELQKLEDENIGTLENTNTDKNTTTSSSHEYDTQKSENETIQILEKAFIEEKENQHPINQSTTSSNLIPNSLPMSCDISGFSENEYKPQLNDSIQVIYLDNSSSNNENSVAKLEDESIPTLERAFIGDSLCTTNMSSTIKTKKSFVQNLLGCFMIFKKR